MSFTVHVCVCFVQSEQCWDMVLLNASVVAVGVQVSVRRGGEGRGGCMGWVGGEGRGGVGAWVGWEGRDGSSV